MTRSDNLGRCAVTVSVIFTVISGCIASHGDSSHPYRKCLKVCHAQLLLSSDQDFHYLVLIPPITHSNQKMFRPVLP